MTEDYKDSYLHERLRERWGGEALAWAEKQRSNKARWIVEHVREELGEQADCLTDEEIIEGYRAAVDSARPLEGNREWWTAEQAAEFFNVTVREIEERYRPLMPGSAVIEPEKEYEYVYDFEREGFVFDKQSAREQLYASKWKKSIKKESTTPFRRGFTINPDRVGGVPQAGDSLLWGTINVRALLVPFRPAHMPVFGAYLAFWWVFGACLRLLCDCANCAVLTALWRALIYIVTRRNASACPCLGFVPNAL